MVITFWRFVTSVENRLRRWKVTSNVLKSWMSDFGFCILIKGLMSGVDVGMMQDVVLTWDYSRISAVTLFDSWVLSSVWFVITAWWWFSRIVVKSEGLQFSRFYFSPKKKIAIWPIFASCSCCSPLPKGRDLSSVKIFSGSFTGKMRAAIVNL